MAERAGCSLMTSNSGVLEAVCSHAQQGGWTHRGPPALHLFPLHDGICALFMCVDLKIGVATSDPIVQQHNKPGSHTICKSSQKF